MTALDKAGLVGLAERVEAATYNDVALFREAFCAVHGPKPERVPGGSDEWLTWLRLFTPFHALCDAGGFLDAAMTLVGEREWTVQNNKPKPMAIVAGIDRYVVAATPALALTAAALRAIAAGRP